MAKANQKQSTAWKLARMNVAPHGIEANFGSKHADLRIGVGVVFPKHSRVSIKHPSLQP